MLFKLLVNYARAVWGMEPLTFDSGSLFDSMLSFIFPFIGLLLDIFAFSVIACFVYDNYANWYRSITNYIEQRKMKKKKEEEERKKKLLTESANKIGAS